MNLHTNFVQLWSAKFPDASDVMPKLDCLKADQFLTIDAQSAAIEVAQSEVLSAVDSLRTALSHKLFVGDYLKSCLTKLNAVSRVFSQLEDEDTKMANNPEITLDIPVKKITAPSKREENLASNSENNFPQTNIKISASPINTTSTPLFVKKSPCFVPVSTNSVVASVTEKPNLLEPFGDNAEGIDTKPTVLEETVRRIIEDICNIPSPAQCALKDNDLQAAAAIIGAALGIRLPPTTTSSDNNASQYLRSDHSDTVKGIPESDLGRKCESSSLPSTTYGTASRPYSCTTCGRCFTVKAGLIQHLRSHSNERPYSCSDCGRTFKQKIQLTTHVRVHSGERPYGCRICGKLFRQQSHVVQHLRTHTGEKPHKCSQCNKCFRQKYSLISHQRRMCQGRSSSSSLIAGMTMWIGPDSTGERICEISKEFKAPDVAAVNGVVSSPLLDPFPNIAGHDDQSTLSNRSCSPSSSHDRIMSLDISKIDPDTPLYYSNQRLGYTNQNNTSHLSDFVGNDFSHFPPFSDSDARSNTTSFSSHLDGPVGGTI